MKVQDKKLIVSVTPKTYAQIKAIALMSNKSTKAVITEAVELYLKRIKTKESAKDALSSDALAAISDVLDAYSKPKKPKKS